MTAIVYKTAAWIPVSEDFLEELREIHGENGPPKNGPWLWEVAAPIRVSVRDKTVLVPWPWRSAGPFRPTAHIWPTSGPGHQRRYAPADIH